MDCEKNRVNNKSLLMNNDFYVIKDWEVWIIISFIVSVIFVYKEKPLLVVFFRKKKRYIEAILSYLNDKHELINDINILIETNKNSTSNSKDINDVKIKGNIKYEER